MFYTVYQITHKTTGRFYIGKHQTSKLDDGYMGSGKILRQAIEKYGIDAFTKIILHIFDNEEEMNAKERELVTEEFCQRADTYNICEGGKGGFSFINKSGITKFSGTHSDETKQKISKIMTGKIRGPLSEETRAKLSAAKKGKPNLSARRPKTEEEKEKIRKSVQDWWKNHKAGLT